jgi:hypothetical protein
MTVRGRACILASVAISLAGALWTAPAAAQFTGFAVDRFEPAERGSAFFAGDTLDLRGDLRWSVGATLDYGYKPLLVYDFNGDEAGAIVRHQLFTHLGGTLVLADRVRIGLNVPVALYQDGDLSFVGDDAYKPADKPAFGDIRVTGDVRLFGVYGDPLTIALRGRAWLPSGQRSEFTSDGSTRFGFDLLASGDEGMFTYAGRIGVTIRTRDDDYADSPLGSEMTALAAAGLRILDDHLVVGPELYASTVMKAGFASTTTPIEWLLGAHAIIGDLRFGAGIGGGLTHGYGSPLLRTLLSVEYAPTYVPEHTSVLLPGPAPTPAPPPVPPSPSKPPVDTDGDGIPDTEDACPDTPGEPSTTIGANGCPPPLEDPAAPPP